MLVQRRTKDQCRYVSVTFAVIYLGTPVTALTDKLSQAPTGENMRRDQLREENLRRAVASGRVYKQANFLSEIQVSFLLDEINILQAHGAFSPSGLSNTAKGPTQEFGLQDRTLCAVPWWNDSLLADASIIDQKNTVAPLIQRLRMNLAKIMNRPTIADSKLGHECYYSVGSTGSSLPRHLDERHEELKGSKGWLLPSRRSLSWLIYLSDDHWTLSDNGGALRSFPQQSIAETGTSSSHNGNLQVGWLQSNTSRAVYMDSWIASKDRGIPQCVLYTLQKDKVVYLTNPWTAESLNGKPICDFIKDSAFFDRQCEEPKVFLGQDYAKEFAWIEDREAWNQGELPKGSFIDDVCPERASLVVFDSLLLPRQVEPVKKGNRIALAGWFHEVTQKFPDAFY